MEKQEFHELCNNCFENLFIKARDTNKVQFLTSFFAFYKLKNKLILDYFTNYVFQEVLEILHSFKNFQESTEIPKKIKTRVRMLLYCHIVEVEFIYRIIFNMVRTIKGLEYSPIIYRETNNKKIEELEYAYNKIKVIKKETSDIDIKFDLLYMEFYNNALRNAFSHSQYFINKYGDLVITRYLSPTTSKVLKKTSQKSEYKYKEIKCIFNKAYIYIETFIKTYNNFLSEFMDGQAYPFLFGNIHFDMSSGKWVF